MACTSETVKLLSSEGEEFVIPKTIAQGSRLIAEVLESHAVASKEMALVVEYLTENLKQPLKRIERPLKSYKLVESGVPDWAAEFIQRVDLADMLELADAASYLRIDMLRFLCMAQIAAAVNIVGLNRMHTIFKPDSAETEKKIKAQNSFGWLEDPLPIVDNFGDSCDSCDVAMDGGGSAAAAEAPPTA